MVQRNLTAVLVQRNLTAELTGERIPHNEGNSPTRSPSFVRASAQEHVVLWKFELRSHSFAACRRKSSAAAKRKACSHHATRVSLTMGKCRHPLWKPTSMVNLRPDCHGPVPKASHTANHVGCVNHTTTEEVQSCADQRYRIVVGTTALLKLVDWFQKCEDAPGGELCPRMPIESSPGGTSQASCASWRLPSGATGPVVAAPAGGKPAKDGALDGAHRRKASGFKTTSAGRRRRGMSSDENVERALSPTFEGENRRKLR